MNAKRKTLFAAAEARFAEAADANEAAGWTPKTYRLRAENGGWAVEYFAPGTNGTPFWSREFFSRDKAAAEAALARRANN